MKSAKVIYAESSADTTGLPLLEICEQVRPSDTGVKAFAQIYCTDEALFIHLFTNEEPHEAKEHGPLAMPCRDSCLEFFLRPVEKELRYFNFEWNAAGSLYLGIGSGPAGLLRIVPSAEQINRLFSPDIKKRTEGWEIDFKIPCSFICGFFPDFSIKHGNIMYANFYKCHDNLPQPHYLAWNMITRKGKYLFHTPDEFGKLYIV